MYKTHGFGVRPSRGSPSPIEAKITDTEVISAQEFVRIMRERPQDVVSSTFCPPAPGGASFGSFRVKFSKARLVPGV